jgi:hypothetical protein
VGDSGERLDELVKKRFAIWRQVVNVGDFLRGSVVVLRRPCTYRNCRLCRSGQRHPATYLSMKQKGRTRLLYLPKAMVPVARQWVAEWKRLEGLLREMVQTNADILRQLGYRKTRQKGAKA